MSEQVAELDGVWGLFQKNSELQNDSVLSINLDKAVNSIIFHLGFLCDTIDGIPFDELSDYVTVNLEKKGKEKFKQELIILGKSEGQIKVWFEFAKFAVENRYRALDPEKISQSIEAAHPLITTYVELAKRINRKENLDTVINTTQTLKEQIDSFFKTDPYMSQALHENSQIPYADWDENYGGS
ncbi:MAG: hypothetical protein F3745_05915 [Nitrospinae bacterium]|nr:hypothetical protein [Nitrospinota bacterium]